MSVLLKNFHCLSLLAELFLQSLTLPRLCLLANKSDKLARLVRLPSYHGQNAYKGQEALQRNDLLKMHG